MLSKDKFLYNAIKFLMKYIAVHPSITIHFAQRMFCLTKYAINECKYKTNQFCWKKYYWANDKILFNRNVKSNNIPGNQKVRYNNKNMSSFLRDINFIIIENYPIDKVNIIKSG